ncbi:MAG: hypothetical protein ABI253_05465 [Mycobacterium sp.]
MINEGPGRDFRWLLHTNDAHRLYEQFGFAAPDQKYFAAPDETYMERHSRLPHVRN